MAQIALSSQHHLHDKKALVSLLVDVHFIPEATLLSRQLVNTGAKKHIGLVVDEYGDIRGLVSLNDILEEVGEFNQNADEVASRFSCEKMVLFWLMVVLVFVI